MADTTSSDTTSKEVVPWHKKLKKGFEYTELKKPVHIIACVRHWLFNESASKVAKELGIGPSHLADIFKSPAAKELREELRNRVGDPVELAKDIAKSNGLGVTLDWYMALEWAKQARDYGAVAKMSKELAALGGVQATPPKQEIEEKKTIRIVLDSSTLEQESVEADWVEVVDSDDDDEDR